MIKLSNRNRRSFHKSGPSDYVV